MLKEVDVKNSSKNIKTKFKKICKQKKTFLEVPLRKYYHPYSKKNICSPERNSENNGFNDKMVQDEKIKK
ncbi:MAG: hypothetical protein LBI18_07045 [Planctomycetaceae bacterium]|nr:hypothetical protein [Planctomycetaceae bacterium]